MSEFNLFKISQSERKVFSETIIESSAPKADFYFLVALSTLIVAFGLAKDNMILVIGGMLVAPLLSSILAISLGVTILNWRVIIRSLRIFFTAIMLSIIISFFTGSILYYEIAQIELFDHMEFSLYTFMVALVAGTAASFTWPKKNLNSILPGIAITVTIIPPLTAIGLALAKNNILFAYEASLILLLNIAGIILGSLAIFFLMKFYKAKRKIIQEVAEEEREFN